jgi:hypothetical protein
MFFSIYVKNQSGQPGLCLAGAATSIQRKCREGYWEAGYKLRLR